MGPEGMSVNDRIDKALCSLAYVSTDTGVELILSLGRVTEMAKMDVKQAYRMVPWCPSDRPLLDMGCKAQHFWTQSNHLDSD